jgi:peptide subunit release factor 1 (eRF1)
MEEKFLVKSSVLKLAERLEEETGENLLSVYVMPGSELPKEAGVAASSVTSKTGMIIFHSDNTDIIIIPNFPVLRNEIFSENKFHTEQLRELYSQHYVLGIVLMHLGEYAVAVFDGDKIAASKCGKHYVHSKHGKGGYSQGRFSRSRKVQMKHYFDEVYAAVKGTFEKQLDKIDYIIYGGPTITVRGFLKQDHFLKKTCAKTLDRVLNVERANRTELEDVMREIWKTRVIFLK